MSSEFRIEKKRKKKSTHSRRRNAESRRQNVAGFYASYLQVTCEKKNEEENLKIESLIRIDLIESIRRQSEFSRVKQKEKLMRQNTKSIVRKNNYDKR